MYCSFGNDRSLTYRRVLALSAAALLAVAALAGCKRIDTPNNNTETIPSKLIETTEPVSTTAPTETTAATDPTEETLGENMAIVKEQVNALNYPTMQGEVLTTLDAGDRVVVERIETLRGISWAYIPQKGWVNTDFLDMSNVTGVNTATPANPQEENPGTDNPGETTTGTETTTGNGTVAIVTGSELNIRSEASTNGDIKGRLTYGDQVTILETSNGWGRIKDGWISMNYVYVSGERGSNPCNGLVTGNQLNVRTGPGTNYDSVKTLNQGARVNVLERIQVGNTTWGCTKDGWICMDYVYVDGTTGEGSGTGTVTGDSLNIRSGPGTNYDPVGTLNSGDQIKIYAQFTFGDMTWGCTDRGWVSMSYVGMG